jgi:hypothetical protein
MELKNKILEFVKEINADNLNSILKYNSDGYEERLCIPEVFVFSTEFSDEEHVKQTALAQSVISLREKLEALEPLLYDEVDAFFRTKKEQLKEKFPKAKLKWRTEGFAVFKLEISGDYDEDTMGDFVLATVDEFEAIFDGLNLRYGY